MFLETKVWISDYGYDATLHAFDKSAGKLGVDQLDLLLLHQPLSSRFDLTLDAYRALEGLLADGKVRAIGVSNFMPEHLDRLLTETSVVPAVNQIELHPYFQNEEVRLYGEEHGIATQAWSPIAQGGVLDDPAIGEIADRLGRTPAQVVLRWHIQRGSIVFPKSTTPARIEENFALFDFELDPDDVDRIDALDRGEAGRTGPHPEKFDLVPS